VLCGSKCPGAARRAIGIRFLPRFGDVILLHVLKVRCFRHVHDGPACDM